MTENTVFYFDKNILYGVSNNKWHDFWLLAQQKGIRGYYSPFTYIEITTGLHIREKFKQNKRCFKLIADANLDVLEYPQMCLAKLLLGSDGIPAVLLRKWKQNYGLFRATPDFILKFCSIYDDLDKEHTVNIANCTPNLKALIHESSKIDSDLLFIVNSVYGQYFNIKFDFRILSDYRQNYESRWTDSMYKMYARAKNFNETQTFRRLFLDALIDISTIFIFNTNSSSIMIGNNWDNKKIDKKLKPMDAFYTYYKYLITKGLSSSVTKNDFHDMGLLVYLGCGFYFITNDNKLIEKTKLSSQRKQIMTFDEAFASIQK